MAIHFLCRALGFFGSTDRTVAAHGRSRECVLLFFALHQVSGRKDSARRKGEERERSIGLREHEHASAADVVLLHPGSPQRIDE